MKKACFLISIVMALTMVAGAGLASAEADLSKHLEISWAGHADTTPPAVDGTWMQKYLEEKWNVSFTFPGVSVAELEAWDLFFAAGNNADMIAHPGSRYDTLISQGVVRPISLDMLYTYAPDWMEKVIQMMGSKEVVETILTYSDGNVYAMPMLSYTASVPFGSFIRTDWLEKLGLEIPTTLDEYHEVIKAFVTGDPDGNGAADTIGISGCNGTFNYIFGAFGTFPSTYLLQDDGVVVYGSTSEAYKSALKLLARWYAEGLIDPESFTDERSSLREKWASGRLGIMDENPWWAEAARGSNSILSMVYANNPEAKISLFAPVTGPDGLSGGVAYYPNILGQGAVLFGADTDDETVTRIMQIKNSFTNIDEYIKGQYGEENVLYTRVKSGIIAPNADVDFIMKREYGIGQFYASQPLSFADASAISLAAEDIALYDVMLNCGKVYRERNFFEPRANEAKNTYGDDVKTAETEYYVSAVTGKVDIDSTWDAYVKQMNDYGLAKIIAEYEDMLK